MKKYQLTQEQTNNFIGREKAMDYVIDLFKRDINLYLYTEVIPKLGLDQKGNYQLSPDRTWLEVTPSEIITKGGSNGKAK